MERRSRQEHAAGRPLIMRRTLPRESNPAGDIRFSLPERIFYQQAFELAPVLQIFAVQHFTLRLDGRRDY